MTTLTLTGEDTLTLNNRVFTDLADDDYSTITFPNDLVKLKTGKNENTIFAKDETGNNADMVLRLIKGSDDDRFMQGFVSQSERDFVSTQLLAGDFVKRLGDGQQNVVSEVITLFGGVVVRKVETKGNASGDTNQAVSVYNMKFAKAVRSMQ